MFTGIVQGTAKLVSIDEKPKFSHACGGVTRPHAGRSGNRCFRGA
ncbi:riboflavin synthase subunit alpha [Escherichia coli]|uniref:Riboflavin synthase subunit alpha n=1 Tax=Escherichia coli TaxID=562 RepID=A0A377K5Z9_ECOLX|nr:riboflavin synthase subunit alpha [Escherichia coli]